MLFRQCIRGQILEPECLSLRFESRIWNVTSNRKRAPGTPRLSGTNREASQHSSQRALCIQHGCRSNQKNYTHSTKTLKLLFVATKVALLMGISQRRMKPMASIPLSMKCVGLYMCLRLRILEEWHPPIEAAKHSLPNCRTCEPALARVAYFCF